MKGTNKQSGVALIIGLLMLLLLTIVMVSAVQVTALEQRMAANLQNQNVAFQAAETALREAETFIASGASEFNPLRLWGSEDDDFVPFRKKKELTCVNDICTLTCVNGLCTRSGGIHAGQFPNVSEDDMRIASTGLTTITKEPRYIIELVDTENDPMHSGRIYATFRVSARAWAGDNSVVQLQSTYRLRTFFIL